MPALHDKSSTMTSLFDLMLVLMLQTVTEVVLLISAPKIH